MNQIARITQDRASKGRNIELSITSDESYQRESDLLSPLGFRAVDMLGQSLATPLAILPNRWVQVFVRMEDAHDAVRQLVMFPLSITIARTEAFPESA